MIDGLRVVPAFVTLEEEADLVRTIGISPIVIDGTERNRVLRYGPGVVASGYKSGVVFDDIPRYLDRLCDRLVARGLVIQRPNAVSVNEYLPGQGIGLHTDNDRSGDIISSLGICGAAVMRFRYGRGATPDQTMSFARRMLVQFSGAVRSSPWKHGIDPVTEPRISIVFRHGVG